MRKFGLFEFEKCLCRLLILYNGLLDVLELEKGGVFNLIDLDSVALDLAKFK
jgi:hypothetical protein